MLLGEEKDMNSAQLKNSNYNDAKNSVKIFGGNSLTKVCTTHWENSLETLTRYQQQT